MKKLVPQSIKNIYHLFQAILANLVYGFPSRKIRIIGVTGTNGKTTVCQMIAKILEEAEFKISMATTINFKIGGKVWVNKTKFTTLSSFATQKFIRQAVNAECKYLILETSSHSLDQNRIWGINFDTAVITNVTREHLDYHKTMEKYRKSKIKLFKNVKTAVVNLDMENPEEFLQFNNEIKYIFTCHPALDAGSRKLDSDSMTGMTLIKAEDIELDNTGSSYKLTACRQGRQTKNYKLNLPGLFNIENALAATCVGLSQNISLETISKALEKIKSIPGRMEYVPNNLGLNIIIDYAVTPDSLDKLYDLISSIRKTLPLEKGVSRPCRGKGFEKQICKNPSQSPFCKGGESKIIAIFGACGERDRGKRPMMGEIVSRFADYIILTNEDPYNEDPAQIINEVAAGIPLCHSERSGTESKNLLDSNEIPRQARDDVFCFTENVNFWKIMDRQEAIKKALQLAKPGDYIIITGKGAEEIMAIGKERIPWNDKKVIIEELRETR
jgi:UDP-N-acetylmuramoyl-L-alanyl-D-glutamate--2,6-diaminopimelate ligase